MRRPRAFWWIIYACCAVAVLSALGWISGTLLKLEEREWQARREAEHQDSLRLALWRMDSWFLPLLARESSRPYFEYLSYYPRDRDYASVLIEARPGDVLEASPLLTYESEYTRLHFQIGPGGEVTSPQAPQGDLQGLALTGCVSPETVPVHEARLQEIQRLVQCDSVRPQVMLAEQREAELFGEAGGRRLPSVVYEASPSWVQNQAEYNARQRGTYKTKKEAQEEASLQLNNARLEKQPIPEEEAVVMGVLVPLWLGEQRDQLFYVRRVLVGDQEYLQGIHFDWTQLCLALIEEVSDLLPGCQLSPVQPYVKKHEQEGMVLASVPVLVQAACGSAGKQGDWTPARATLAMTWIAVAVALAAAGITMRSSISFGEKRSRFASAVTHELRTPLTTFQMYSEMLADGMVRDGKQRQVYLETLKEESHRLSSLVENVLSYARLEEGRAQLQRRPWKASDLLERLLPALERRVQGAGMELGLEVQGVVPLQLETDVDAVGQILLNLVDNACKYANGKEPKRVELKAWRQGARLCLQVQDYGPGIRPAVVRQIFTPFERADHESDTIPGIGLGLALSKGMAEDLGGTLTYEQGEKTGASFLLTLPLTG
jgi:signal transduction histidine kinase